MDISSWKKSLRRKSVAFLKMLKRVGRAFVSRDQKFPVLLVGEQVKDAPEETSISLESTWNVFEDHSASEFSGGTAFESRAEKGEEIFRGGIPL